MVSWCFLGEGLPGTHQLRFLFRLHTTDCHPQYRALELEVIREEPRIPGKITAFGQVFLFISGETARRHLSLVR